MYELKKADYEQIFKLIKVSRSINKLYKDLYELEISDKNNTDEYNKTLDYLSIAINVEFNMLKNIKLTGEKASAWAQYLIENMLPVDYVYNVDAVMSQEDKNNVVGRLFNYLIEFLTKDDDAIDEIFRNDITNVVDINDDEIRQALSESVDETLIITQEFENELFDFYLYYLNMTIKLPKYKSVKKDLIKSKYCLSFLNRSLERKLINSKFKVLEYPNFNSKFTAYDLKFDLELYEIIKTIFGENQSIKQMNYLLEMKDNDYKKTKNYVTSILRNCLLRASLQFVSVEGLDDLEYQYYEYIDSDRYLSRFKNDTISKNNIRKALNHFILKSKKQSLTLKPERD